MEIINPKKQEKQQKDKKNKGISINMMNVLENIDDDEIEEIMGQEEEKIEEIRKEFQYATKINIKKDENFQINMERQLEPKEEETSQQQADQEMRQRREEEEENSILYYKQPINHKSLNFHLKHVTS